MWISKLHCEHLEYLSECTRRCFGYAARIWIRCDNPKLIEFLDQLVGESNCFLFWAARPTLLVDVTDYEVLKDFMRASNLWNFVEKIQTQFKLSIIRITVKVITFYPQCRSIIAEFKHPPCFVQHQRSLCIAKAYEWLTPSALNHSKKQNRYRYSHVVLYLVLDYHRRMGKKSKRQILNLFDLCALRLAMFDPRYYQHDQCEIPGLIHSEIRHIIQLGKQQNPSYMFSPTEYLIQQGMQSVSQAVAEYFIIYASNYCDFVSESDLVSINYSYTVWIEEYIRLYSAELYEPILIDFVQNRPFLKMIIFFGSIAIGPILFRKLVECSNIIGINMNVDFPIIHIDESLSDDLTAIESKLQIVYNGTSEINYISEYIEWVKPLLKFRKFTLSIQCPIADYTIFNNLNVDEISFNGRELTTEIITELRKFEVTAAKYQWRDVKLKRNFDGFKMLNEFGPLTILEIIQDENTFELIFRFVEECFQKYNRTNLEYGADVIKFYITVKTTHNGKMNFKDFTFKLNDDWSQIELNEKKTQQVVDIYDWLADIEHPSKDEFEFYE